MRKLRQHISDPSDNGTRTHVGVDSDFEIDPKAFSRLQRQVSGIEREMGNIGREMASLASSHGAADSPSMEDVGGATKDARWPCSKCGSLLAFYDPGQDVLRVRYKDHTLYAHLGEGGWITVLCRGCGELNTQQWVERAPGTGPEPPTS